jgi:hypothetical protein
MNEIDLLIVSPGGVGCTYLLTLLNKHTHLKTNDIHDNDGLKHLSTPYLLPSNINIKKIIFVWNDPLKAINSHYRRANEHKYDWQVDQCKKLGNPYHLEENVIKNKNKLFELTNKYKHELFGIEYQFLNWYNAKLNIPILFVDFRNINKLKNDISKFLNISNDIMNNFKNIERHTYNINETSKDVIQLYTNFDYIVCNLIDKSNNY